MQPGDYVIFYSQGLYSYIATVKLRIQNADLAEALWGRGEDVSLWELIYFVTHPIRIDIPLENLADVLTLPRESVPIMERESLGTLPFYWVG
jgi:hypothetical protein